MFVNQTLFSEVMASAPKFPIRIVDKNGLRDSFESLADAEKSVEADDVHAGEYVASDATGKRLKLVVEKQNVSALFGLIKVEVDVARIKE